MSCRCAVILWRGAASLSSVLLLLLVVLAFPILLPELTAASGQCSCKTTRTHRRRFCTQTVAELCGSLSSAKLGILCLIVVSLLYLMLTGQSARPLFTSRPSQSDLYAASLSASPESLSFWTDLTPPLSRESLGQATWSFLHTLAALYPQEPSVEEQRAAVALFESLAVLYPCDTCRTHYRAMLTARPPRVSSRAELTAWLCETHNEVNGRLGKDSVDCGTVHERWPPELGKCGCSADDDRSTASGSAQRRTQ